MTFKDIVLVVEIISNLEFQWGTDSSLEHHANVIYVAEVRRTCEIKTPLDLNSSIKTEDIMHT